jgi:hypothetical protein
MTSAAYQSTYLEPNPMGGFTGPLGTHRYKVAGALYQLQQKLREGNAQAAAQAYVATNPPNYLKPVIAAAGALGNQAILTDFQSIDSL